MKKSTQWLVAAAMAVTACAALAQGKEIKIAHVYDKTGPLAACRT